MNSAPNILRAESDFNFPEHCPGNFAFALNESLKAETQSMSTAKMQIMANGIVCQKTAIMAPVIPDKNLIKIFMGY